MLLRITDIYPAEMVGILLFSVLLYCLMQDAWMPARAFAAFSGRRRRCGFAGEGHRFGVNVIILI